METEFAFSGELLGALTVLFAVCILVPVMYYVWNVYRRKLSHVAILGGLAAFFLFGYVLSQSLLRGLDPEALGTWGYALLSALIAAACDTAGIFLGLWLVHRQQGTIRVPIGFGLGYRIFEMFYLGGLNTFLRLSYVMTVTNDGLESVLSQVEEGQRAALESQLRNLAESNVGMYWMSAVDYAARFALTVALARLVWYAIEGGRKPEDKRLIALAFGLDLLCELMLSLHAAGASYVLCAIVYYVLVAFALCLSFYAAKQRDDPEKLRADRLRGRARRR